MPSSFENRFKPRKDREGRVSAVRVREETYTTENGDIERIEVEEKDEEEYCYVNDDRRSTTPPPVHRYFGDISDLNCTTDEIIETNTVCAFVISFPT